MTWKKGTILLLLIAGLAGCPAPSAAWELATHSRAWQGLRLTLLGACGILWPSAIES
jgi:hypothetical protein